MTSPDAAAAERTASSLRELAPLIRVSEAKFAALMSLEERPRTASEVSRLLQIDKSAAFRHLKTLTGAGFAQRRGSLGKWVYYELTDRGRLLLRLGRGVELTPLRV